MREIYIVDATQVVTSESHPEGMFSHISGYPMLFDSRSYEATEQNPDGNANLARIVATAEFHDRVKQCSLAHNRAKWAVTMERSDGTQYMRTSEGAFPVVPVPEEQE